MGKTVSTFAAEFADREAIRDCLMRYARGVDRCDRTLLEGVYWPDATDEHGGFFNGNAIEFLDMAMPHMIKGLEASVHFLGNLLIDIISPDKAETETYVIAYERQKGSTGPYDAYLGARYVDQFEKRQDEWRILKRVVQFDWFRILPDTSDWKKGWMGLPGFDPSDRRDRTYDLFTSERIAPRS